MYSELMIAGKIFGMAYTSNRYCQINCSGNASVGAAISGPRSWQSSLLFGDCIPQRRCRLHKSVPTSGCVNSIAQHGPILHIIRKLNLRCYSSPAAAQRWLRDSSQCSDRIYLVEIIVSRRNSQKDIAQHRSLGRELGGVRLGLLKMK
jgi:hypothetical protein